MIKYNIDITDGAVAIGHSNIPEDELFDKLSDILKKHYVLGIVSGTNCLFVINRITGDRIGTVSKTKRYQLVTKVVDGGSWREHKSQFFDSLEDAALDIRHEILGTMLYGNSNLYTYDESIILNHYIYFSIIDSLADERVNVAEYIAIVMGE